MKLSPFEGGMSIGAFIEHPLERGDSYAAGVTGVCL